MKPIQVNAVLNISGDYSPLDVMNFLSKLDKHTVEIDGKRAVLTLTKAG